VEKGHRRGYEAAQLSANWHIDVAIAALKPADCELLRRLTI
jgi:hypothetical protein